MKAVQIQRLGGVDGLQLVDLPEPSLGAGEVAVRVRACSLNFRDLMVLQGSYNPKIVLPAVPLSDGAGEVVGTGGGVTRFKTGDRVAGGFMPGWVDGPLNPEKAVSALGAGVPGMLAETVVLPATGVVKIPDHLSYEEAATLPCAALTAWNALAVQGGLKAGDTVLVQGTGGVSVFAMQIARMSGARVIATSSSDAKLGRMKAMGASELINYRSTPDWDKEALQLTGGVGVDHVVEVGGADTLGRSLNAVRASGRVSVIGILTSVKSELNIVPVLMKSLTIQGIYVGSIAMFEAMNRAFALHEIRPVIDRVFPIAEVRGAYGHLQGATHLGKVVITL